MIIPKRILRIAAGMVIGILASCSNSGVDPVPVEIIVSTGFSSVSGVETRGEGSISSESILLDDPLPVSVVRIDQVSTGNASWLPYMQTNMDGVGVPLNGALTLMGSEIRMVFDTPRYYLLRSQNNHTKLIAWYPAIGEMPEPGSPEGSSSVSVWNVDGSGVATVSFTIDGETDILVSDLVEGSRSAPFSDAGNGLTFRHALARFRVKVYALDPIVPGNWGGLKTIALQGQPDKCVVRLPGVSASSHTFASGSFTGSVSLPLIYKDPADSSPISAYAGGGALAIPVINGDVDADGSLIGTALAGYVMTAPCTSITLNVVNELSNGSVTINSPAGGFKAGHSYTLALKFTSAGIEVGSVRIEEWDEEGSQSVEV